MKSAYLTIDDSPSKATHKKIDFLLSKKIPAVLFCRGTYLEKNQEDIIYAIKNGFIIGNHTYNHPRFSKLPLTECYEEIRKCDAAIDAVYKKAGVLRPVKWFRFSYGDKGGFAKVRLFEKFEGEGLERKKKIQAYLKRLGYTKPPVKITYPYWEKSGLDKDIDWYWTYDVMEYMTFSKEPLFNIRTLQDVLDRMDEDDQYHWLGLNSGNSAEIILLHDHDETTKMFKPIVEKLMTKVKFVSPIAR